MPRAVLDPNVLVSALISPTGSSARLLIELRAGSFELVTSEQLLAELGDVLHRDRFRRYVTQAEAAAYVEFLRQESILLDDPEPSLKTLSIDPDDEYLIDLARSARAEALVSGDDHVLRLRGVIPAVSAHEFLKSLHDQK